MPNRGYSTSGSYRYGFNGKENDNEVRGSGNELDYGLRIYDPRLGKFLSVDPLTKSYPWNSTYAFAENDVIRSVDLDGLERKVVVHWVDRAQDDGALKIVKTKVSIDYSDNWREVNPIDKSATGRIYAITETYYYFFNDGKILKGKDYLEEVKSNSPLPSANYDYTSAASMARKEKDDEAYYDYKGSIFNPLNFRKAMQQTKRDLNAPDNAMIVEDVNMGTLAFSSVVGAPGLVRSMLKIESTAINGSNVLPKSGERNIMQDIFKIKALKGNAGIAAGTEEEAMALGSAWVNGEKVTELELKDGIGFSDGTRTFRLQWKPKLKKWVANFEENTVSESGQISKVKNVHMEITDKAAPTP